MFILSFEFSRFSLAVRTILFKVIKLNLVAEPHKDQLFFFFDPDMTM